LNLDIQLMNLHIYYKTYGAGPNVLLLHGWGASIDLYQGLLDRLAQHFTVYALDMPGVGRSDEPPEAWCVDDYVDLVSAFIKEMGIKKTHLIGHSFGGRVITKMMNRPERPAEVDKIVFIDAAGIKPKKKLKTKIKVASYKAAKVIFNNPVMHFLYPDYLENMRKRNGSADYNAASPVMRATLVRVVNEDLKELLPGIDRPTLLIWGENDPTTPLKDGQEMERLIPDAGLVVAKGAGHFSYLEQPGLVYGAIEKFFGVSEHGA
jgi:pimeloyl-ACP methyl ester carboxylesterase